MTTRGTICLLILSVYFVAFTLADIFPECGSKENMYIASDKGCSYYILCYGEDSFEDECEADAPYFSEVEQTCDTDVSVCKREPLPPNEPPSDTDVDVEPEVPVSSSVRPPIIPEAPTAPVTVAPTIRPSTVTSSTTSSPTTPTSPTSPSTSTTAVSVPAAQLTTAVSHIASECPAQDDPLKIVFLQDPTSCSNYFMCYHGEPLAMHCSNMLHFDINSQKCDYPENVRCLLDSGTPRERCQTHTVDVYPHPTNCNYYYLCRNGYLMIMQCPSNMDWDEEKRACVLRPKARCRANQQRSLQKIF